MGWGTEGGREDAVQAERVLEKSKSEVFHRCSLLNIQSATEANGSDTSRRCAHYQHLLLSRRFSQINIVFP